MVKLSSQHLCLHPWINVVSTFLGEASCWIDTHILSGWSAGYKEWYSVCLRKSHLHLLQGLWNIVQEWVERAEGLKDGEMCYKEMSSEHDMAFMNSLQLWSPAEGRFVIISWWKGKGYMRLHLPLRGHWQLMTFGSGSFSLVVYSPIGYLCSHLCSLSRVHAGNMIRQSGSWVKSRVWRGFVGKEKGVSVKWDRRGESSLKTAIIHYIHEQNFEKLNHIFFFNFLAGETKQEQENSFKTYCLSHGQAILYSLKDTSEKNTWWHELSNLQE